MAVKVLRQNAGCGCVYSKVLLLTQRYRKFEGRSRPTCIIHYKRLFCQSLIGILTVNYSYAIWPWFMKIFSFSEALRWFKWFGRRCSVVLCQRHLSNCAL